MQYDFSEKNMNDYKNLCKFDNHSMNLQDFKQINRKEQKEKAAYISKHIDTMDEREKKNFLVNIISDKKLTSELLKFELRYINKGVVINNIIEFADFVEKMFQRYHMKSSGFLCEDSQWTKHSLGSQKYPLTKNEIIFENSIKRDHIRDETIEIYISDIFNYLDTHRGPNINIAYKLIETTDDIYWMIFKISELNKN